MSRYRPGFRIVREFDSPVTGTRQAIWAQANVHVKFEDPNCPGTLWRELVASRLASACGLPVPPGDLAMASGSRQAWVTAKIAPRGQELPPPNPATVASQEPELAAGVLVFDCWLANLDRSDGNLMYEPSIGLWLIDHEQAFASRQPEELSARQETGDDHHVFAASPLDDAAVDGWASLFGALPLRSIKCAVQEAVVRRLLTAPQRDMVVDWLTDRRGRIRALVKECRHLTMASQPAVGEDRDDRAGGGLWPLTTPP